MQNVDKIVLTIEEYNRLMIDSEILKQLELNGVDNWSHYGCMCQENNENECIFCAEDELSYLGLPQSNK